MTKKVYLVLLGFFCCLGVFFYATFHEYALEWAIQSYSTKTFGQPLTYRSFHYSNGRYFIEQPRLGQDYMGEEAAFHYAIDWWKREIHLFLSLQRPYFRLREKDQKEWKNWEKWQSWIKKSKAWFTIHPSLAIHEGHLFGLSNAIHFNLHFENNREGELKLNLGHDKGVHLRGVSEAEGLQLHLDCSGADVSSLMQVAQLFSPSLKSIQINEGVLNGSLSGSFSAGAKPRLLGELELSGLIMESPLLNLSAHVPKSAIHFKKCDNREADFSTEGQFVFSEPASLSSLDASKLPWALQNIKGDFHLGARKGTVQLNAEGRLLEKTVAFQLEGETKMGANGMDLDLHLNSSADLGKVHLFLGSGREFLKINVEGFFKDFKPLLPASLATAERLFEHHPIKIETYAKNRHGELDLLGSLEWGEERHRHELHFGAEVKKKAAPAGWFYSPHLDIRRLASSLPLFSPAYEIEGAAEIKGFFEESVLTVYYEPGPIKVKNPDFEIALNRSSALVPGQFNGYHQIDFKAGSHKGSLPIREASYLEKHSGLLFTSIQGQLHFLNSSFYMDPFEAECEGAYLEGTLQLSLLEGGENWELRLSAPNFSSPLQSLQKMIGRDLDLKGDLYGRGNGLDLKIGGGENFLSHAMIEGSICDGETPRYENSCLKGLFADFKYDHQSKNFEINECQGSLYYGKPRLQNEYACGSNKLTYSLLEKKWKGDFWVKKEEEEIFALIAEGQESEPFLYDITVSPHSHFCHIPLGVTKCQFKKEGLEAFAFETRLDQNSPSVKALQIT
ncbi:MAG: hypothetical protein LW832_05770, partial [Parachlamydia sp.]|nr:hypothetical protein [Parachlamydia sp.]